MKVGSAGAERLSTAFKMRTVRYTNGDTSPAASTARTANTWIRGGRADPAECTCRVPVTVVSSRPLSWISYRTGPPSSVDAPQVSVRPAVMSKASGPGREGAVWSAGAPARPLPPFRPAGAAP